MKKLVFLGVAVALIIGIPVLGQGQLTSADPAVVYETELVPKLQNVPNVGTYTSVALEKGEVKVYSDGGYKVEIEGLKLDEVAFTGDLTVRVWDIKYSGGIWQRGATAALPATINLEDGEGTLEVECDSSGSISSGDHPGFFVQVNDPGVAWLLMSGFSIE